MFAKLKQRTHIDRSENGNATSRQTASYIANTNETGTPNMSSRNIRKGINIWSHNYFNHAKLINANTTMTAIRRIQK